MPDLKSLENVYLVLGLVAPGLIIVWVRSQFTTGRTPPHSEAIVPYLAISVMYYAAAVPAVQYVIAIDRPGYLKAFAWIGVAFIGPAIVGLGLGIAAQKGFFRRLLRRIGLNPVHHVPSAWDWKFGDMLPHWVLVVLKDGTKFAGFCGEHSFASSDPTERDLYLERVYDIDDGNAWHLREDKSVLIMGSEVRSIEFWPYYRGSRT